MFFMNFQGISFMLLTFEKGWKFQSAVYQIPNIAIFVLFAIFRFSGITRKAAKLEEKLKLKAQEKASTGPDAKKEK